jgi:hypothetical protein
VFNPNASFKAYSFFDFDDPERQGCDAVRVQYYPSETSVIEFAAKMDAEKKSTLAAMYRFNHKSVDFQMMTGWYNEIDWVIGGGVVGDVEGVNVRSELACFVPLSNDNTSSEKINISLGLDYIFGNSLMLSGEILYSSKILKQSDFSTLLVSAMNAKNLSIAPFTAVAQVSYPFSPIFTGSLAMMSFMENSQSPLFYVGPSISANPFTNLTLTASTQLFLGDKKYISPNQIGLLYVGLKWNF